MRAIWDHPRNISDDQARASAAIGGVIGITGVGIFLGPNSPMLDSSEESSHNMLLVASFSWRPADGSGR